MRAGSLSKNDLNRNIMAPFLFALAVMLVGIFTMPATRYVGDPSASQEEAFQILYAHDWAIPLERVRMMQSQVDEGQYFVLNARTGQFHSKYGVAATMFYLLPAAIYKFADKWLPTKSPQELELRWVLFLNCLNLIFCFGIGFLLYKVCLYFTDNHFVITTYCLATVYSTYLWNYLRAQTTEIFQVFFFLLLFDLFVQTVRDRNVGARLISIWFCAAALLFIKIYFVILIPMLFITLVVLDPKKNSLFIQTIPPLIVCGLLATLLHFRFGSIFATGYHQWRPEEGRLSTFYWDGLVGFLLSPRKSIFIYYPLLVASMFGFLRFWKKYPFECAAPLVLFLASYFLIGKLPNWAGDTCYGPRYLLFVMPVLCLPSLEVIQLLVPVPNEKRTYGKMGARILFLLVVSIGFCFQIQANKYHFFSPFVVHDALTAVGAKQAAQISRKMTYWNLNSDLENGLAGDGKSSRILEAMRAELPKEKQSIALNSLQKIYSERNYWFFR